ncbi:MAG TPA: PEP/pyruvate-binding domain-containing protein, partial [Mycobacterium sp.]|nr:PEP/pyruvate-binding domain-containing protein [Mycobacterium sp.]
MTVLVDHQVAGQQVPGDRERMLAGGKGRTLCALTAAGFPVPRWAIIGVDAFEAALDGLGLCVSDAPLSLEERLRESARLAAALAESPVPPSVRDAIATALNHVGATSVAVRSSALQEDGSCHSFAGLFESFLNISGIDAVEDAVRRCWASAFSPRVVHYRHTRGLGFDAVAVAVIVQRFIEPVSSGVMFTADPVTPDPGRIVISGVLGVGEGLVSGTVDADSVVVEKATRRVLEETVAVKPRMVVPVEGAGTSIAPVPTAR